MLIVHSIGTILKICRGSGGGDEKIHGVRGIEPLCKLLKIDLQNKNNKLTSTPQKLAKISHIKIQKSPF